MRDYVQVYVHIHVPVAYSIVLRVSRSPVYLLISLPPQVAPLFSSLDARGI